MSPPDWKGLILILGKGDLLLQVGPTCSDDDAGVLKRQGGTAVDNTTTERTVVSHINLREKMRTGTWNVRNMNQGKLDIVKRNMERIGVNLLGVSEKKWTVMGHVKLDNHKVYYCGQDAQIRNGVAFIKIMYRRNTKMCYGIQPCKLIDHVTWTRCHMLSCVVWSQSPARRSKMVKSPGHFVMGQL